MTRTFICPVCGRQHSTERNTYAWICSNCNTYVDEYTTFPADGGEGSTTIIKKGDGWTPTFHQRSKK